MYQHQWEFDSDGLLALRQGKSCRYRRIMRLIIFYILIHQIAGCYCTYIAKCDATHSPTITNSITLEE